MHMIACRKMHDEGSDVIGESPIALAQPAQRVPDHDIGEKWQGRVRARGGAHDRRRQSRVVEDRVDPLIREALLEFRELRRGASSENAHGQLRVVARETLSRVRENHETTTSVSCSYPEVIFRSRKQMLYRGHRAAKKGNNLGTHGCRLLIDCIIASLVGREDRSATASPDSNISAAMRAILS